MINKNPKLANKNIIATTIKTPMNEAIIFTKSFEKSIRPQSTLTNAMIEISVIVKDGINLLFSLVS